MDSALLPATARLYRSWVLTLAAWLLMGTCLGWHSPAVALTGMVLDEVTRRPVVGATLVAGREVAVSDAEGRFSVNPQAPQAGRLSVRAPGYWRWQLDIGAQVGTVEVALRPVRPKALYLSAHGIGSAILREQALELLRQTELNALVIDVKDDRGLIPYRSAATRQAGLEQPTVMVGDMPALISELHCAGIYLIARLVTFKDEPFAAAHPEWAVHDAKGDIWRDREGLAWIDPFQQEAWTRTLALAEEAATLGFDEIQFDYVRFPDSEGLRFSKGSTRSSRTDTIAGFLRAARQRLAPYNVFISADIFGYVAWNEDDTGIGQTLQSVANEVDYVCPMLYPSGFTFGIPGHRHPMEAPHDIVDESLRKAMQRTGLPGVRFRPWLQAFRDYAFDHRAFGDREIRGQIEAADAAQTHGWMLWNAQNRYESSGLGPRKPQAQPR